MLNGKRATKCVFYKLSVRLRLLCKKGFCLDPVFISYLNPFNVKMYFIDMRVIPPNWLKRARLDNCDRTVMRVGSLSTQFCVTLRACKTMFDKN